MREITIGKNEANQRIDKFLRKYMPKASMGFIYKMIRKKNIKLNNKRTPQEYILKEEDQIQLYLSEETIKGFLEEKTIYNVKRNFDIVYEDKNLILVNKPQGLLVHEDHKEQENTLVNQVIKYLYDQGEYNPKEEKTFVPASVNRLDRNTSGIVIIAKNYETLQNLNEMVRKKEYIRKYYLTIVKGQIKNGQELKGYLMKDTNLNCVKLVSKETEKAKFIYTKYKPIKTSHKYSLLEVEIITGRTHQIRLHLSSTSHPIIGDDKYGDEKVNKIFKDKFNLKYQFLHAYKITFYKCIGNLKYLEGKNFNARLSSNFENIKEQLF